MTTARTARGPSSTLMAGMRARRHSQATAWTPIAAAATGGKKDQSLKRRRMAGAGAGGKKDQSLNRRRMQATAARVTNVRAMVLPVWASDGARRRAGAAGA